MESANNITKYLQLTPAVPVIRHGLKVNYKRYIDCNIDNISLLMDDYISKNYSSIAVICKDEQESVYLYERLKNEIPNMSLIINSEMSYNGGICIITSYLSKGLEFDGVIISNASNEKYTSKKIIDMKLLYVAMTRALHELNILYKDNINEVLECCLE